MSEKRQEEVAKRLLDVLAEINRTFRDHAVRLRRSSVGIDAQASVEVISYTNGPVLEGYVDATLANGDRVCWCLDVRWNNDAWTIEAAFDRKLGDRQETVRELPTQTVGDFDCFLNKLKQVTSELLAFSIP